MTLKKRFAMEKLVRDNIEHYLARGIYHHFRILSGKELTQALKTKLIEESQEVLLADQQEQLIEELADLQEVILNLMQVSGITQEQVEEKRKLKKMRVGGFEEARYIYYVDVPEDCPEYQYFLAHPQKYPEIKEEEKIFNQ